MNPLAYLAARLAEAEREIVNQREKIDYLKRVRAAQALNNLEVRRELAELRVRLHKAEGTLRSDWLED